MVVTLYIYIYIYIYIHFIKYSALKVNVWEEYNKKDHCLHPTKKKNGNV